MTEVDAVAKTRMFFTAILEEYKIRLEAVEKNRAQALGILPVLALTALLFALDIGPLFRLINGVLGTDINFLADADWFRPIILLQTIWKNTGWGTIIFLAALATVDQEQYEAAIIDGAGRFARVWHITLPSIMPVVVVMLVLNLGQVLDTGFEQIYLMTNSLNREVADVFDTFVYHMGITQGSYSYSTAVGLFKAVVGVVLIFGSNAIVRRMGQPGIF